MARNCEFIPRCTDPIVIGRPVVARSSSRFLPSAFVRLLYCICICPVLYTVACPVSRPVRPVSTVSVVAVELERNVEAVSQ